MHTVSISRTVLRSLDCFGGLSGSITARASTRQYSKTRSTTSQRARFSSTPRRPTEPKNRVYSSVRNQDQFTTYLQLSSSSRRPLLTLWTTSWCATCHQVSPLLKHLIESEGVGEAEGGVTYAEVEYDAPDVVGAGLGLTYMINSVPTLLSFDAGEAQVATKVVDGRKLAARHFLEEWIRTEARRHGGRGGGGGGGPGGGGSLFGGLFGNFRG